MVKKHKIDMFKVTNAVLIINSVLIALVQVFAILLLRSSLMEANTSTPIYFFLTMFFLSLAMGTSALFVKFSNFSKIRFFKFISLSGFYFVLAVVLLFIPYTTTGFGTVCLLYFVSVIANRICLILEKKKVANIIYNSFLMILCVLGILATFSFMAANTIEFAVALVSTIVIAVTLGNILSFAFERMKLGRIIKVIRKTYALEVLYGLLVLVFTFSFIFYFMGDGTFESYGDALWYSFSIVTTIGFGDYTVKNTLCRILSVILGLYGIVVVAVLTSVIINFYSETNNKKDDETSKQVEEKKSQQLEEKEPEENK